jgi:hypothetical protein
MQNPHPFMANTEGIQSIFLEEVKKRLPDNVSFADGLAETLNISRDSAYRRMRGETVLSLDEVKLLCNKYAVSLDSILSSSPDAVSFRIRSLDSKNFSFDRYLQFLLENLERINAYPEKELIWYAKDLPIWHYFRFPRLAAFKLFFWDKTFVKGSRLRTEKYRENLVTKDVLALAGRVWSRYAPIPSTEILGNENLDSTLNQIAFAYECGVFNSKSEALDLCDDCVLLMNHIKSEAEDGIKKGLDMREPGGRFDLYHNEVLIGDNSVLFKIGDKRMAFITANQFSILTTSQESFCKLTEDYINNMINKSTLISATAEKERAKFFNAMLQKIAQTKEKIK